MSKSGFDKLTALIFFSFVYVALTYVIWNFVIIPAVIRFGDILAARAVFSCSFDEVLLSIIVVHLLFCATKLGKKKEIK